MIVIHFWLSQTWPFTLRIHENMFSDCTVPPDTRKTNLGNCDQMTSQSASKSIGVVLVLFCAWKCISRAIASDLDILEASKCHLLRQMSSWMTQLILVISLWGVNGIKMQVFFKRNIEKKHLCHHDKNYYYFCKSNISVTNLIVGSRNMIKLSKNMSL